MPGTRGDADPVALEIAWAAQEAAESAIVILFGSRARGDHRPNSDVDLLVIANDENAGPARVAAGAAVSRYLERTGIRLSTDIIGMTRKQFSRCRLAKQHIAGQADTYGIVMSEDRPDSFDRQQGDITDDYPNHWPETKRRLENVEEYSHHFNEMTDENHWNQKMLGFMAQQMVENALKGWLSAYNDDRNWGHDLNLIWHDIQQIEDWSNPDLATIHEFVTVLLEWSAYDDPNRPERPQNWLSDYAVIYRYLGTSHRMARVERLELQEKVNNAVAAMVDRIHAISGTTESDVYPDGLKPWDVVTE